jgi:hypothetical protein
MAQKIEQYKFFYFALLIRHPLLPFTLFRIGPPHRPQRKPHTMYIQIVGLIKLYKVRKKYFIKTFNLSVSKFF